MSSKEKEEKEKDLKVREKKELKAEEGTREGLYFEPDVDIHEDEQALTLVADVPGASEKDIHIDLMESVLTVSAGVAEVEKRWKPLYGEYRVGHFSRKFRIGQSIDQDGITAKLKDGVLSVKLPKARSAQPRKIEVAAG